MGLKLLRVKYQAMISKGLNTKLEPMKQIFTVKIGNSSAISLYYTHDLIESHRKDGEGAVFYIKGIDNWILFQKVMNKEGIEFNLLTR